MGWDNLKYKYKRHHLLYIPVKKATYQLENLVGCLTAVEH